MSTSAADSPRAPPAEGEGGAAGGAPRARGLSGAGARGGGGAAGVGSNRATAPEVGKRRRWRPAKVVRAPGPPPCCCRAGRNARAAPHPRLRPLPSSLRRTRAAAQAWASFTAGSGQDPGGRPCVGEGCRRPKPPAAAPLAELAPVGASTSPLRTRCRFSLGADDVESERVGRRG
ncbi:unnamed protein product [Urochloa humidicola]